MCVFEVCVGGRREGGKFVCVLYAGGGESVCVHISHYVVVMVRW